MAYIGMLLALALFLNNPKTRIYCLIQAALLYASVPIVDRLYGDDIVGVLTFYSYLPFLMAPFTFLLLAKWKRITMLLVLSLSAAFHKYILITQSPLCLLWYSEFQIGTMYAMLFILSSHSFGWKKQVLLLVAGIAAEYFLPNYI